MQKNSAKRILGLVLRAGPTAPLTDAQLLQEFRSNRSADAFTEIVRRHGSMVLGVCRRVLRHEQDAEDAFQATFLVLAKKAGSIRPPEALGRWLYGVAFRTAQKAKSQRHREQTYRADWAAQPRPEEEMPPEPADWLPLLDQELNRLSERERLPIVLCDLLGRSRKEAAAELGLSEGTLSSRLARARERLRGLLERRGVVPAITVGGLTMETCSAPAALIDTTCKFASAVTNSTVLKLAEGVIYTMALHSTVKMFSIVASVLLAGGMGAWWGWAYTSEPAGHPNATAHVAEADKTDKPQKDSDAPPKKETKADSDKPIEKKDDPKDKLDRLNGIWKVVYAEGNPPAVRARKGEVLQRPKFLRIEQKRLTWESVLTDRPARSVPFHLRLEASAPDDNSGRIDIGLAEKFQEPDIIYGIYHFDRERLWICWSTWGRPLGFSTESIWGDHYYSVALQRVPAIDPRAAAREAAEEQDLQLLQGEWRITKVVGTPDANVRAGNRFQFQGSRLKYLRGDADDATREFFPVLVNPRTAPKELIRYDQQEPTEQGSFSHPVAFGGIYRIEKDRLEICWRTDFTDEKSAPPKNFEVGKDSKTLQLILLERGNAEPKKSVDSRERMEGLYKELESALRRRLLGLEARLPAGKDPPSYYLDVSNQLMEAQLKLAADKASRLQAMEAHLQRLIRYERLLKSELEAGKTRADEVALVKAKRLMAEILIESENKK